MASNTNNSTSITPFPRGGTSKTSTPSVSKDHEVNIHYIHTHAYINKRTGRKGEGLAVLKCYYWGYMWDGWMGYVICIMWMMGWCNGMGVLCRNFCLNQNHKSLTMQKRLLEKWTNESENKKRKRERRKERNNRVIRLK